MTRLEYSGGEVYHGFDGDHHVTAEPNTTIEVTPAKAEQLLADFPHWFTAKRQPRKAAAGRG